MKERIRELEARVLQLEEMVEFLFEGLDEVEEELFNEDDDDDE